MGADHSGAWASLEDEALNGSSDELLQKLAFNAVILRTNHKSSEAWTFRRFLLSLILKSGIDIDKVLYIEKLLVEDLARRYDHHYYAWNHWSWLSLSAAAFARVGMPDLVDVTPSHYGLFHHRIARLRRLAVQPTMGLTSGGETSHRLEVAYSMLNGLPDEFLKELAAEQTLCDKLLGLYPHIEAPWLYSSQLFAVFLEALEAAATGGDGAGSMLVAAIASEVSSEVADLWSRETSKAEALALTGNAVDGRCDHHARRLQVRLLHELLLFDLHLDDDRYKECTGVLQRLHTHQAASPAVLQE